MTERDLIWSAMFFWGTAAGRCNMVLIDSLRERRRARQFGRPEADSAIVAARITGGRPW